MAPVSRNLRHLRFPAVAQGLPICLLFRPRTLLRSCASLTCQSCPRSLVPPLQALSFQHSQLARNLLLQAAVEAELQGIQRLSFFLHMLVKVLREHFDSVRARTVSPCTLLLYRRLRKLNAYRVAKGLGFGRLNPPGCLCLLDSVRM